MSQQQKPLKLLIILVLMALMAQGCRGGKLPVDRNSGYLIRQDTPVSAAVTFNTLLGAGSYEASFNLLTSASRLNSSPGMLESIHQTVRLEGTRVINAEAGPVRGNLAVAGVLLANDFAGVQGEVILAAVEILRREGKKWYISRDPEELSPRELKELLEMIIPFQEQLLKSEDFFVRLNPEQKESAVKQLEGFLEGHRVMLEEISVILK